MNYIDMIGLFGAFLSGITFLPQVYRTWKLKSARDLSLVMILIILLSNIEDNITTKDNSDCKMYTIHSYKSNATALNSFN